MGRFKLKPRVSKRKERSKSENTLRAYAADWRGFVNYCKKSPEVEVKIDPANVKDDEEAEILLVNYLTWLQDTNEDDDQESTSYGKYTKGISQLEHRKNYLNNPYSPLPNKSKYKTTDFKAHTLQRKLAAIIYHFKKNGIIINRKKEDISETMAGFTNDSSINKKTKAKGLKTKDIKKIIDCINEKNNKAKLIRDKRDKSLILLIYFSFSRRSEILDLKIKDLYLNDDGGLTISIEKSKTDREGKGRQVYIHSRKDVLCPVNALLEWLNSINYEINNDDHKNNYIFFNINKSDKVDLTKNLTPTSFVRILKKRAEDARYSDNDVLKISGHSLRIGAISQAHDDGLSYREIMEKTGHRTEQMISEYTQISEQDIKNKPLK